MRHFFYSQVPLVDIVGSNGAKRRWLTDPAEGAEVTVMFVELKPGCATLHHRHSYEHVMYFLEGNGEVLDETGVSPVAQGEVLHIKANELHQIKNSGNRVLNFLAIEATDKGEKRT
jgi:quercetin dioxygenase-like cupin family protein